MIKPYAAFILASSFLLVSAMPRVYADENLPASNTRIQRSFVNLSFENLVIGSTQIVMHVKIELAVIGQVVFVCSIKNGFKVGKRQRPSLIIIVLI